jgi:hypothetical protein
MGDQHSSAVNKHFIAFPPISLLKKLLIQAVQKRPDARPRNPEP